MTADTTTQILNVLNTFQTADESLIIDRSLQDRVDEKYAISSAMFPEILEQLQATHQVVLAGDKRIAKYDTLYYDSDTLEMFHRHRLGRRPRYKVRTRHYIDRDLASLEVKCKGNNDRTVKERAMDIDFESFALDDARAFIEEFSPYSPEQLEPSLSTVFDRIILVGNEVDERLTFDINLSFNHDDRSVVFPNVVLAELKQPRATHHGPGRQVFRQRNVRPMRLSKYCVGVTVTRDDINAPRFAKRAESLRRVADA